MKKKLNRLTFFFYKLISPIIDPIRLVNGIYGYFWFIKDLIKYKLEDKKAKLININLYPSVHERLSFTPFDQVYFYQQLWVFENVMKRKPYKHIDVGSTYQMSGYLSKIVKAVFVDLRPIKVKLPNLTIQRGDVLNLPFKNNSVESLSCLHVAEHVGLGRYGDSIDPEGTIKACKELTRVLKPGGHLYFSIPIGKERICFNAHRVYPPKKIVSFFKDLKLISFSVVNDQKKLVKNCQYEKYNTIEYGCGFFEFTKKV